MKTRAALPAEWTTVALGEIAEVANGRALPRRDEAGTGGIPVYSSGTRVGEHDHALHPGPSVVVGRKGTVGSVRYVPGPFWCTDTAFFLAQASPDVELEFLALALAAAGVERLAVGTGIPGLQRVELERQRVALPPVSEQRRIVEIVRAADALAARTAEADAIARAVPAALFVERFGDPVANPRGWPWVRLEELVDAERGVRAGPSEDELPPASDPEIAVFGPENVGEGELDPAPARFVSLERAGDLLRRYEIVTGDVLVTRGDGRGRMAVLRAEAGPAILGPRVTCLPLRRDVVVPEYFVTLATGFGDRVTGMRAASGAFDVTRAAARSRVVIPLPPMELQERFRAQVERIDGVRLQRRAAGALLAGLRASIAAAALTGELTAPWRVLHQAALADEVVLRDTALAARKAAAARRRRAVSFSAEIARAEMPAAPAGPRAALRSRLGPAQRGLLEWIESTRGHVTAAALADRPDELAGRGLTAALVRQGLALLEQTGLVQCVAVPRQGPGHEAEYVTAYRALDGEDHDARDRADDTALLSVTR